MLSMTALSRHEHRLAAQCIVPTSRSPVSLAWYASLHWDECFVCGEYCGDALSIWTDLNIKTHSAKGTHSLGCNARVHEIIATLRAAHPRHRWPSPRAVRAAVWQVRLQTGAPPPGHSAVHYAGPTPYEELLRRQKAKGAPAC
jgi:hypothetical protein